MEFKKPFFTSAGSWLTFLTKKLTKIMSSDIDLEIAASQNFMLEYFFQVTGDSNTQQQEMIYGGGRR